MRLVFGPDFPAAPPKGVFVTPIFHPNVSKQGEICVNTLKKDWKADCKLSHILMVCSSRLEGRAVRAALFSPLQGVEPVQHSRTERRAHVCVRAAAWW